MGWGYSWWGACHTSVRTRSLDPQKPHKFRCSSMCLQSQNSCGKTGGKDRRITKKEAQRLASLAYKADNNKETPVSNKEEGTDQCLRLPSDLCMHTEACVCTCTHTLTHASICMCTPTQVSHTQNIHTLMHTDTPTRMCTRISYTHVHIYFTHIS